MKKIRMYDIMYYLLTSNTYINGIITKIYYNDKLILSSDDNNFWITPSIIDYLFSELDANIDYTYTYDIDKNNKYIIKMNINQEEYAMLLTLINLKGEE